MTISRLDKSHWQEYKKIRLEVLKNSPENFLFSFDYENKFSDNDWISSFDNNVKIGYFIDQKLVAIT